MSKTEEPTRVDVERTRAHLRMWIEETGFSQRVIARRIGMKQGTLSVLLKENGTNLQVGRVSEILQAIGVPQRGFYGRMYGFPTVDLETRVESLVAALIQLNLLTHGQLEDATRRYQGLNPQIDSSFEGSPDNEGTEDE